MTAINYDVPTDLHRRIKIGAAVRGVTVKQYVLDALEAAADADDRDAMKAR